jgi:hypothetical protein
MAKKANIHRAKKAASRNQRKRKAAAQGLQARPSYANLTAELQSLVDSLSAICSAGKDDGGALSIIQKKEALMSLQALQAAREALRCPQLLGPYEAHTPARPQRKSRT